MNTDTDMWLAFARIFGLLFIVLAIFLLVLYLFRRFSGKIGVKSSNPIQVLAVHHISPKEKLMLVNVLNENILIGVTSQTISRLATLGEKEDLLPAKPDEGAVFSDMLKKSLKRPSAPISEKEGVSPAGADEGELNP